MHGLYTAHAESGGIAAAFKPLLTSGALKPHLPGFVLVGKAALETPAMREAIKKAFREDGLFDIIRQPERVAAAREEAIDNGEILEGLFISDGVTEADDVTI